VNAPPVAVSKPWLARARLGSLWLSQVARITADNALRIYIALRVAEAGAAERDYAWHLLSALLMLPAVALAPFNGAICNTLPKRLVLTGSAIYCCVVVGVFGLLGGPWVAGWALLAAGMAVYSPTRYALLPAAATDTQWPLTRVNGWIEMGAVSAIVAGMALGVHLERDALSWDGWPPVVVAALALNLVAIAGAWPAAFPSDIRRPESAGQAIAGFFRDAERIWRDREARAALLGMASLRAIVTGATGAFFAILLQSEAASPLARIEAAFHLLMWILLGAAVGSLLAGLQRHPRRALGFVPLGASGLFAGLILAAAGATDQAVCFALGVMGGLINVPLAAAYQLYLPADARGNGMAIRNLTDYVLMAAVSILLFTLAHTRLLSATGQMWLMAGLAGVGMVVAWRTAYREAIELITEWVLAPFYRIKARGDGIYHFPARGPLLVVANHGAWLDPLWLAKVLPRSLRPMMTSAFYDLPFMRWLMQNVARAIRVQYSTFRREAPELKEAIEALDAGEVVVIFPEASLRRSEDRPLRRFGQGVFHILSERPQTAVVVCWIEGNWGSFFSYYQGPPTKNKRMDFWRPIDIAVSEPMQLGSGTLADHRTTRAFLEQRCREMRAVLGLEVPRTDNEPEPEDSGQQAVKG
jgi:1-acyl-sn-glycerol-3-phosphate acyltransferase